VSYAAVGFDGLGEAIEGVPDAVVGESFILLDENRGTLDIGMENDGELAWKPFVHADALLFGFSG
jgi:hypothetical protein